jgi:heat shock protein HslJ
MSASILSPGSLSAARQQKKLERENMNVSIARLALALIACTAIGSATAAEHKGLAGTSWQLLQLGSTGALSENLPTLTFSTDGKVSGTGGCNTFTGSVTESGMNIKFGAIAATKKACSQEVNAQEAAYFKALEQAQTFENRATSLLINTKAFNEPLSFVPVKP